MFPIINKRETGVNLRRIMDKNSLTVKDIQQYLGLGSVQSVYHWLNGISMPTIDNLYALSDLFKVPIDEIVRGNRPQLPQNTNSKISEPYRRRLYAYYKMASKQLAA